MSKNALTLILFCLIVWIFFLRRKIKLNQQALENRTREREAVLSFLHKIGERVTRSIDLQGSLEIITNFIVEYSHAESGAIFLMNEGNKTLKAQVVLGLFPPLHKTQGLLFSKRSSLREWIMRDKIEMGEGIIGSVARTGESQLIEDGHKDPRVPQNVSDFVSIETLMVSPLKIKDKVLGVLAVVNRRDGQNFTKADLSLLESLSDQAAVTVDMVKLYDQLADQQRIEQELRLAKEFQNLLLPKTSPQVPGLDIAAFNEPAMEVGGDYYDFIWIDEDHLGIVIADVAGKGIPGALVMAMVRSILRAESRGNLSPVAVLKVVNEYVRQDTQTGVFITMTYAVINIHTRIMRFARAGHEPVISFCMNQPEPRLFTPEGIALGLVEENIFNITSEKEINLAKGDLVVLYTDGVVEAMNDTSQEYGQQRLLEVIGSHREERAESVIQTIIKDIKDFTREIPQQDDITIIAFKVYSASNQELSELTSTGAPDRHP